MSLEQKISKAKAKLLVNYPFFGSLASRLEIVQNDDIQAFKSDGLKLEYNSDFIQKTTISELEFVFANGAMHSSLAYDNRKNNRSGWLWQLACDYAINDMLVENDLDRPDEAHYSKRFSGLYAEEIYAELKEMSLDSLSEFGESTDVNVESSSESNQVSKLDKPEESSLENVSNQEYQEQTEAEQIQSEQLFEEFTKATLDADQKKDELPKDIDRFFKLNSKGVINWRDELRAAIDKYFKDDYVLIPPNKKFLHLGIYLPSNISQKFRLVVAVDSSGSIDEELLSVFISELNFLMSTVSNYEIDLLVCDDKIQSHNTYYNGDILDVQVIGGGATDFRPVFDFIEDNLYDINLLLYFSDLDGVFPHARPNYDVKWISPKKCNYPFGELISLEDYSIIT